MEIFEQVWAIWLIVAGVALIIEFMTSGFLFFWFTVAGVLTALLSLICSSMPIQAAFFIVVSVALIISTKPLVKKFLDKNAPQNANVNIYTIINKTAVVTTTIDNIKGSGQIKIDSDIWSARSDNGETIEAGSLVKILRIEGVKVIVEKFQQQ